MEDEDIVINDSSRRSDGNYYLIRGDQRITTRRLTFFEVAKLIAVRTQQIDAGCPYFVDLLMPDGSTLDKASHIAAKELNEGRCPLLLRRFVGSIDEQGRQFCEEWDPNELARDIVDISLLPE
jgi:DNA-directed RNA polymerase subunit K/omega